MIPCDTLRRMSQHRLDEETGAYYPTPGRRWIWVLLAIALVVVGLGILNC